MSILPDSVTSAIKGVQIRQPLDLASGIGIVGAAGTGTKYGAISMRPDTKIAEYVAAYKKDARVRSAIDLTVYYAVGGGWKFMAENDDVVKRAEKIRERLRLDSWMREALKVMIITGDCYTEIRHGKKGKENDAELMVLPSEQMHTNRDEHGNLKDPAYTQTVSASEKIPFPFEAIQHMYEPFSSEPEGISRVAAAHYAVKCLWELEELMLVITDKFAAPLLIASLGDAENLPDPQALENVKNKLAAMSKDKNRFWAVPGVISFEQIESARAALNVQPYLDYFERQVYAALNVPPILMGKPEGSNRTSAQVMMDSFERYVNSLQSVLADSVKTILHRFGLGEVPELVFNEIAPEDEAARVLRHQRMLGSDRSIGWATIDEIRRLEPELHGTWEEAMNAQSIPDYEAIAKKGGLPPKPKRQQPPGTAPGEPKEEPEEPEKPEEEPKKKGERSGTRPAAERGTEG